jgi:hypothetical protein
MLAFYLTVHSALDYPTSASLQHLPDQTLAGLPQGLFDAACKGIDLS